MASAADTSLDSTAPPQPLVEKRKLTDSDDIVIVDNDNDDNQHSAKKVRQECDEGNSADSLCKIDSSSGPKSDDIGLGGPPRGLDPLSYTQDDFFTSEIFKIKVTNLPNKFGFSELKARLQKEVGVKPHKIKSTRGYDVAYVCFKNEEEKQIGLQKVNGHVWKGCTLKAVPADPAPDPYYQTHLDAQDYKRTKRGTRGSGINTGRRKERQGQKELLDFETLTAQEADNMMRDSVTPLWKMPYAEQLEEKTQRCEDTLRKLTLHHFVRPLPQYREKYKHDGMACPLLPIIPSPVIEACRNKNEYAIGLGLDGKNLTVGFRYGMYKNGSTAVGSSDSLTITSPKSVAVAQGVQEIAEKSGLPVFVYQNHQGHWQNLTVRVFTTGQSMAILDLVVWGLSQEQIDQIKTDLKNYFLEGKGKDLNVTSFYLRCQPSRHRFPESTPKSLIFGEKYVHENILGHKFRVSPEAFFQVNSTATEKLYSVVADWSCLGEDTTILDVCCGTGTIGLTMATKVKEVIGIDSCPQAIEDAKVNAELNGISNATYYCSKVEEIMGKLMTSFPATGESNLVAIVDPPRAGLCKTVMKVIRKHRAIQRLVFVSCNASLCLDNFADLIRLPTNNLPGIPFVLVRAIPVDLFPMTRHVEMVLLFERNTGVPAVAD